MSLYKQLGLLVGFLLLAVFGSSLLLSTLSAQRYLQQQLSIKNADNATALALSLSQQGADPVLLELTLSAQFDTGFYERILLRDTEGKVLIERSGGAGGGDYPRWLPALLPLRGEPGVANVQDGWRPVGTLRLQSHAGFAYEALWQSMIQQAVAFFIIALAAGVLGNWLLHRLLRPLDAVVAQASALGQRRFLTVDEPRTQELRILVHAMNTLARRVQQMLRSEGERLRQWQQQYENDPVTGLLGRERFATELATTLGGEDVRASGVLAVAHVRGMNELNRQHGRAVIDAALETAGRALDAICRENDWVGARLNGSDLALLAPAAEAPLPIAAQLCEKLRAGFAEHGLDGDAVIRASCTTYTADDGWSPLLARLDATLSEQPEDDSPLVEVAADAQGVPDSGAEAALLRSAGIEAWREELEQAFAEQRLLLEGFAVTGADGSTLHREYRVRMKRGDEQLLAGHFLPWIQRLGMSGRLDYLVTQLALALAPQASDRVCINLSAAVLRDAALLQSIEGLLAANASAAAYLAMEIEEASIYRHLDSFRLFCTVCHRHGIEVGMDRTGRQLSDLGKLHDVGLDYVKLEPALSQDIEHNEGNRNVVGALCTLIHAIGCRVIATDVRDAHSQRVLVELGVDGISGPGLRAVD